MTNRVFLNLTDDEPIDKIEMVVEPRFKTSGISGDEWRHSVVVRFYRKGHLIHEDTISKMREAAALLPGTLLALQEGALHDGLDVARKATEGTCMQVGCSATGTVTRVLKKTFCLGGHAEEVPEQLEFVRMFCAAHATRGDCDLEDADANYRTSGGSLAEPATAPAALREHGAVAVDD